MKFKLQTVIDSLYHMVFMQRKLNYKNYMDSLHSDKFCDVFPSLLIEDIT